jgi:hypothetical protein
MNNLYSWHAERMVDWEMQEIRREIGQACLLKEAGLAGSNGLARAIAALLKVLITRRKSPQGHRTIEPQSYQSTDHKSAP